MGNSSKILLYCRLSIRLELSSVF